MKPRKPQRLTPAMKKALDYLEQNNKHGIVQTGTENVLMQQRDPKTGKRFGESLVVTNQTLLALKRRGLVFCVHMLNRGFSASGGKDPRHQKRRWHVQAQEEAA
jgi:hypothetical protein